MPCTVASPPAHISGPVLSAHPWIFHCSRAVQMEIATDPPVKNVWAPITGEPVRAPKVVLSTGIVKVSAPVLVTLKVSFIGVQLPVAPEIVTELPVWRPWAVEVRLAAAALLAAVIALAVTPKLLPVEVNRARTSLATEVVLLNRLVSW